MEGLQDLGSYITHQKLFKIDADASSRSCTRYENILFFRIQSEFLFGIDAGLLVHCISGWDRTPLFISLLRITLWADRQVHQSLRVEELLYLTVAYHVFHSIYHFFDTNRYDWLLFSHQLYDRASRGEDIFYFCFYFLQFMQSSEFCVPGTKQDVQSPPAANHKSFPPNPEAANNPLSNFSPFEDDKEKEKPATKPPADRFASLSVKLNSSSSSLPNIVAREPARPPPVVSALSVSLTASPSIPIVRPPPPPAPHGSPSPGSATSFSLLSSTPSAGTSSGSGTNGSYKSGSISIPNGHSHSHSHSHAHSHSRHSHVGYPTAKLIFILFF